jgi:type I restriction enzyme S subunit
MRAASGLVAVASEDGIVSPDYAVFDMIGDESPHYFVALFKTRLLQSVFRALSKGLGTGKSGFLRLYSEDFLAITFPVPPSSPKSEQDAIVAAIRRDAERTADLRMTLSDSTKLLKERRAALISAAVTGEIEPGLGEP